MKKYFILGLMLFVSALQAQKFEDLAKTPPMGWNSWNKFACDINEKTIRETADAIVSSGMRDAGYVYLVIDDCWQVKRDSNGTIIADPERFPSGMKNLGDYIHSKGLKFGIYSDAGTATCQGRPGSCGYEFQDARTYASWGVDYLKYDWCNHGKLNSEGSYTIMRDALYKAGRPIVFSICEWGTTKPWEWAKNVGHLWRSTEDIINCFDCKNYWGGLGVVQIIDLFTEIGTYTGPGHWNDADMLEVGNGVLSPDEEKLHISMWSMFSSPLMAGNDLRTMSKETVSILTNNEVLAIDQDKLGISAIRWMKYGDLEIWFKPLEGNSYAFCFINRGSQTVTIDQDLKTSIRKYVIDGAYDLRDLWKHQDIGSTKDNVKTTLGAHAVLMLKLTKK
ncbi:MAG: glycoside hydrolase family 27 protein [Bacteroidetes bacterium]|nr:glycoside hydrolase family 27 protein [Bacteroidota bacterium]